MRPINIGDKVEIVCVPNAGVSTATFAEVLHAPDDTGDLWYFKRDDGEIIAINPNCSIFLGLKLIEQK